MKIPKTEKEILEKIAKLAENNKVYKELIKSNNSIIDMLVVKLEVIYKHEQVRTDK